jgi:hypothetical protein
LCTGETLESDIGFGDHTLAKCREAELGDGAMVGEVEFARARDDFFGHSGVHEHLKGLVIITVEGEVVDVIEKTHVAFGAINVV